MPSTTPDHVRRANGVVEDFEASLSGSPRPSRRSMPDLIRRSLASLAQVLFVRQRLGMP